MRRPRFIDGRDLIDVAEREPLRRLDDKAQRCRGRRANYSL
jgi:hypothetical protein